MSYFNAQDLLSKQSKEQCIEKLKKIRVPKFGKIPTATAAVLVPLCVVNGTVSLLYTIRTMHLRSHAGQTSFPGGKTDHNETPTDTAVREAEEEIGVKRKCIDVWGEALAVPGRNNKIMITPVIGAIDVKLGDLKLNSEEVREVFTVPLSSLCDPKNHFYTRFSNGIVLPVFLYEQYRIWGISAYITHIFLSCLLPKEGYNNDWAISRRM